MYESGHNKRTQNIGLNYLSSRTPIWYAGPDLVASKILTGKVPRILRAIQIIPGNPQKNLKTTNLGGMVGVNLIDGHSYQIAMQPTLYQDEVVPESFRILLRKYLGKSEVKSLAPDGTPCIGTTRGLLQRARITADKLVPVGKETDRRWEQGEDPSMIDSDIFIFEKRTRLVIADPAERKRFAAIGLRRLARESNLSLAPVGKAIKGKGVRRQTLSIIRQTAARILAE